jgi:hypothetical protein
MKEWRLVSSSFLSIIPLITTADSGRNISINADKKGPVLRRDLFVALFFLLIGRRGRAATPLAEQ